MSCCCGCLNVDDPEQRRVCMPYKDGIVLGAQITSVVGFVASVVVIFSMLDYLIRYSYSEQFGWTVAMMALAFCTGLVSLIFLQIVWCFRPHKGLFFAVATLSIVNVIFSVGAGLMAIIFDVSFYVWAVCIAFVAAACWLGVSVCVIYFCTSGRFEMWEDKYTGKSGKSETQPETGTGTETGKRETDPETGTGIEMDQSETGPETGIRMEIDQSETEPETGTGIEMGKSSQVATGDADAADEKDTADVEIDV